MYRVYGLGFTKSLPPSRVTMATPLGPASTRRGLPGWRRARDSPRRGRGGGGEGDLGEEDGDESVASGDGDATTPGTRTFSSASRSFSSATTNSSGFRIIGSKGVCQERNKIKCMGFSLKSTKRRWFYDG
jgi:hypothetical protein